MIETNMIYFQTVTSMLQKSTTAVPMLFATIPKYRTIIHVNLDILVMDGLAKVDLAFYLLLHKKVFLTKVNMARE